MRSFYLLVLLFLSYSVYSQNIQFTASAKKVVETGERFRLTYSVNAKASNFKAPTFSGVSVLSGPSQSSSSSVQIINGQYSQEITTSFSYILVANNEGKISIAPAEITVDGKVYKSNALEIEVVKGTSQNNAQQNQQQSQSTSVDDEDLFVRVILNKKEVYVGEPIVATLKVYTRARLSNFKDYKFPTFSGFSTSILEEPNRISLERENVNGKIYEAGLFRKILLYPQKSGSITIEPFELECILLQQVQRRSFFDSGYREYVKKVKSKPIDVTVKSLPANRPGSYTGAVGNFNFTVSADKTNLTQNEALNIKLRITGTGNLKIIDAPKIDFPSDFEVYDPKINLQEKNTVSGAQGSKTFEYLIIPRTAGDFTIPAVSFTYFDLATAKFKTISSNPIKLIVERGEEGSEANIVQTISKKDVTFLGKDIHYQKTGEIKLYKKNNFLLDSILVKSMYFLFVLMFIVIVILKRKQIIENQNIAKRRNKNANKISKKRLKTAAMYLKQKKSAEFYEEIMRTLWGYISDKLNIPQANLTKDNVSQYLNEKNIEENVISEFLSILDTCEFARYSPSANTGETQLLYDKTIDIINKMEQLI